MPKSKYQLDGIVIVFYSNDHAPPHFHARKPGEWEIRVFLEDSEDAAFHFDFKWQSKAEGLSRSEISLISEFVRSNRESLKLEWKTFVCEK